VLQLVSACVTVSRCCFSAEGCSCMLMWLCVLRARSRSHLALHDELVSKAFQGRHGRAYLFGHVINVSLGPKEDRMLTTGLHTVCDIFWSAHHAEQQMMP
jgi:hypothetical protein